MAEGGVNGRQANLPAGPSGTGGDAGASPKLRGLDGNPQGAFGPRVWQAFRDTLSHRYTVSLPDPSEERSLADIARCCGFGGKSQFSRAFRAHFGAPPRQYLALIRQQDLDWHEARLAADEQPVKPNAARSVKVMRTSLTLACTPRKIRPD